MYSFLNCLNDFEVPEGKLGLFWIGQAGFIFKTHEGQLMSIDPYLSDCCKQAAGFKRLMPYLFMPDEVTFDVLLVSHSHPDHLDTDAFPALTADAKTKVICARDVYPFCCDIRIAEKTTALAVGEKAEDSWYSVEAVNCDHGELAPEAVGFVVRIGGKTVYYMGDTACRPEWYQDPQLQNPDVLLLPINGAFGNLNEEEAANVCRAITPKLAIPYHYWNFAEHGGSPYVYMQDMEKIAPDVPYCVMRMGEGILI